MRDIDAATLTALNGSRASDTITVYAWYDGNLVQDDPLPISTWSMSWDLTRQVQTANFTVTDKDGKLAPWLLEDPLGVGGTQLQVIYNVGGAGSVNLAWYRITQSAPDENWRSYVINHLGQTNLGSPLPPNKRKVLVSGGAQIAISGADLALHIKNARLLAPQSPQGASPTNLSEITRLLADIVPVDADPAIVDKAVNKSLIYDGERIDAIEDLCDNLGATYRMNGDGHLEVYPIAPTEPVWTIAGGPEGVLVRPDRSQSIEGLYNVFVAEGTDADNLPLRGIAEITDGPLRNGGPHGTYPLFFSSNMLTTQSQVNNYALQMRDTQLAGLTVDLEVTCLPNPALQQGDYVRVASPVVNGQTVTLDGRVKTMSLSSDGTVVQPMVLTVQCSYDAVQAALSEVDRG